MTRPIPPCYAQHNAIKRDHDRWSQLELNGFMRTEDDEGNPMLLELRTCGECRRTLAVIVTMRDKQEAA